MAASSSMPPLRNLYFDPVVLSLLGNDALVARCLAPVFDELRQNRCDIIPTYVSTSIFALDACGLRLWVVYSPDRTEAEITGYTLSSRR